jgi:gluconate 5-dehydrogenase
VVGDLAQRDQVTGIAERVSAAFGPPDILVNAAGINTREPADEITPEGWDVTLNLNLAAPFFLAQALVPGMRKAGWGRILNFASLQSYRAFPGGLSYGATKGGVVQMTRAMAQAWSAQGITANAIGPGFFRTELTAAVFAEPSDIDGPVLFLCSDAGGYVTGQTLMVDGGFTAK